MIRNTFQLVSGIGPWREKDLWARGYPDWNAFCAASETVVSKKVDAETRERIEKAREALAGRKLEVLASLFPAREHWRLYEEFGGEALFFDVETDGRDTLKPTVVSVFGPRVGLHAFVEGRNMHELPEAMAQSRFWVSFNGSVFDVPVLEKAFEHFPRPDVHVDLRFLARKQRLGTGLKALEEMLGIGRPPHLRGTNGMDAVLLWRRYLGEGDIEALRFLVEYNLYDAFQLRGVIDRLFNESAMRLGFEARRLPEFDRGDILYDVTKVLMALEPTELDLRRKAAAVAAQF
jgi:uncharacterized protein